MKVAIVGGSPLTWNLAPFKDESWEIWCLGNQLNKYEGKRISRLFEIHENLTQHKDDYPQWLVDHKIPLVVSKNFPIKADHVSEYPKEEVEAMIGQHFTSSPSFMMGLAVLEGATEISLYGIEMAVDDHEYFFQRNSMYAWIGYAKGKGIKVTIPDESSLFRERYNEGRDWNNNTEFGTPPFSEVQFALMRDIHIGKIKEINTEIDQLKNLIATHDGARQAYDRLVKVARAVETGADVKTLTDVGVTK